MSGGSMDYLSYKVEDAFFISNTLERIAFRKHLKKVADALHKIEWNDSGDGADGEEEAIMECITKTELLESATEEANRVLLQLKNAIDKAAV